MRNFQPRLGKKHGIPAHVSGIPCLAHFDFDIHKLELKTLYTVLMLKRGYMASNGFYPTLAHTPKIVDKYIEAIDEVFAEIAEILKKDSYDAILEAIGGPVCQSDFKRLLK